MYEAPNIVSTCINCFAPGSFTATLIVLAMGVALAIRAERRQLVPAKPAKPKKNRNWQFQQVAAG